MHVTMHLSSYLLMISLSQVYAAADPVNIQPITTLVSELTQKATGEFDKVYHQLEEVLGQLAGGGDLKEVESQLDPQMLSRCNCYCHCPHDQVDSQVVAKVKDSVVQLKERVEAVGRSLRDKIHQLTAP